MPVFPRRAALFVLPVLCALSIGCVDIAAGGATYIDTVEKRFVVSGTPTLKVGTFDGSVDVSTWDRPEVVVTIEKHAVDRAAADRMLVTAEQNGDEIRVDVRDVRDGGIHLNFGSHSARITITVPERTRIDANTGDGRVTIRDVEGDINVRTGDGAIRLEHVNGDVAATSGDGSIDVEGSIRQLNARSGDGRVHVHAFGTGPTADWRLATGDGSVVLEVPDGFGAELDAATGDGRVQVRDMPFDNTSGSGDRSVARGRIGQGGGRITIRSGDGSITVRPSDARSHT